MSLADSSDAKCTFEIVDTTISTNTYGLKVNIFWPMHKMPKNVHCADIVLIRKVKVIYLETLVICLLTEFVGPDLQWQFITDRKPWHGIPFLSIHQGAKISAKPQIR